MRSTLGQLCEQFNLPMPELKPEPPISKETLKGAFNQALDTLLPASDLIKIAMGTMEMPTTKEEWVKVAVSTVLDSMPFGKMFKLLQSSAAKLGVKKIIEAKILIIAAKKAKKAVAKSINQLNKLVKAGKAPKSITRFDRGRLLNAKPHVHFSDGAALNIDGTWKHGSKILTNKEINFLKENGWTLP